ncbi:MAG: TetR/AcrR family transcriptional regulator [Calditrichaeota bacterium]|nr:TetR/AcrR family transcriptional regulator [Candidatus Cloacimonadota bacterium]MCB1047522.1 TetR/AcrR family transcriptional regulator [Calditrichota bacterium]MCB9474359.1 TetR/AcrR family transcriptional regulator [Candidatus Delongbacteria bacterium]
MNSPDRRELILEAAAGCFSHFGYRRTVVDDIAREVGIAKGSIYLHFKSKEELFIALLDHEREKVSERFEEIISLDISCSERLRRIVVEFNAILDRHPVLARFMTAPASLELPPELLHRECHDKGIFDQHIPRILENGIRGGEFRADLDVLAVFPIIISLFHINVHNRDHKWVDMPPEKFMEAMLGTIFQGILNKEGSVR